MFTQRAFLLGFVGFCFYLIAVVNSLPSFYYVLTWLSLGLLSASLAIAFLSLSGLEIDGGFRRRSGFARFGLRHRFRDDSAPGVQMAPIFEMSLRNRGSLNKTGVVLELQFEPILSELPAENAAPDAARKRKNSKKSPSRSSHQFLLEAIPAGQKIEIVLPLELLSRGRHRLVLVRLIGSDVLGLFRVSRKIKIRDENASDSPNAPQKDASPSVAGGEIVVGPVVFEDVVAAMAHSAGRELRSARVPARTRQTGRGEDVRALRPYIAGDDLRHIHWKTTARTGAMMVKEWENSGRARALVWWLGGHENAARNTANLSHEERVSAELSQEIGLCVAASLQIALQRAGWPCATLLAGEKTVFLPSSGSHGELSPLEIEAFAAAKSVIGKAASDFSLESLLPAREEFDALFLVVSSRSPQGFVAQLANLTARGVAVFVIVLHLGAPQTAQNRKKRRAAHLGSEAENAQAAATLLGALHRARAQVHELHFTPDAAFDEHDLLESSAADLLSRSEVERLHHEIRRVLLEVGR